MSFNHHLNQFNNKMGESGQPFVPKRDDGYDEALMLHMEKIRAQELHQIGGISHQDYQALLLAHQDAQKNLNQLTQQHQQLKREIQNGGREQLNTFESLGPAFESVVSVFRSEIDRVIDLAKVDPAKERALNLQKHLNAFTARSLTPYNQLERTEIADRYNQTFPADKFGKAHPVDALKLEIWKASKNGLTEDEALTLNRLIDDVEKKTSKVLQDLKPLFESEKHFQGMFAKVRGLFDHLASVWPANMSKDKLHEFRTRLENYQVTGLTGGSHLTEGLLKLDDDMRQAHWQLGRGRLSDR